MMTLVSLPTGGVSVLALSCLIVIVRSFDSHLDVNVDQLTPLLELSSAH